jgi:acyl carrier protein
MNPPDRVSELVYAAIRDLAAELQNPELAQPHPDLRLIGSSSPIDSMALVSLIADLEGRISAEFGKYVILADESAMSAYRSPFRSVAALIEYIRNLLGEPTP